MPFELPSFFRSRVSDRPWWTQLSLRIVHLYNTCGAVENLLKTPRVGCRLLGRLAVATNQGNGARCRIAVTELMAYALVVARGAKDDAACVHYGFVLLGGKATRLVPPIATALTLVGGKP
jgi:hypothetical protein